MSTGRFPTAPQHHFQSIAGHGPSIAYLLSALEKQVLPHALLFHGPKGVGKLSVAYALAKRLNCDHGNVGPCPCDLCRKISSGTFADILLVEPRGATGQLTLAGWKPGKDDPDGLQYHRFVDTAPLEGRRKILILRDVDRMNIALANYLLKLIEEPPSYLMMILLTRRRSEVLNTIRSRCAPVRFNALSAEELRPISEKVLGPGATESEFLAAMRICGGIPERLIQQATDQNARQQMEVSRLLDLFRQHGFVSVFRVASDLENLGKDAEAGAAGNQDRFEGVLRGLMTWLRDAVICKTAPEEIRSQLLVNRDRREAVEAFARNYSVQGLTRALGSIEEYRLLARRQMDKNYVLESLLLRLGVEIKG